MGDKVVRQKTNTRFARDNDVDESVDGAYDEAHLAGFCTGCRGTGPGVGGWVEGEKQFEEAEGVQGKVKAATARERFWQVLWRGISDDHNAQNIR